MDCYRAVGACGTQECAYGIYHHEFAIGEMFEGVVDELVVVEIEEDFGVDGVAAVLGGVEVMDFSQVGTAGEEAGAEDLGGIIFAADEEDGAGGRGGAVGPGGGGMARARRYWKGSSWRGG